MSSRALTPETLRLAERLWDWHRVIDDLAPCDAIVGLGSHDLRVAAHCAGLLAAGWAPFVLFTGGFGNWTRDAFDRPEALLFRDEAIRLGAPADAVLTETSATNIGENLRLSLPMLEARGVRSAIVVTKPNTLRRVRATAPLAWPAIRITLHAPPIAMHDRPDATHGLGPLIDEMVGDVQRMQVYPRRGFQVAEAIPAGILEACADLVRAGFDRHGLAGA